MARYLQSLSPLHRHRHAAILCPVGNLDESWTHDKDSMEHNFRASAMATPDCRRGHLSWSLGFMPHRDVDARGSAIPAPAEYCERCEGIVKRECAHVMPLQCATDMPKRGLPGE